MTHLNPARGKPVKVRRDTLQVHALVADVVPTHVVDHDEEYVRLRGLGLGIRFPSLPFPLLLIYLNIYWFCRRGRTCRGVGRGG